MAQDIPAETALQAVPQLLRDSNRWMRWAERHEKRPDGSVKVSKPPIGSIHEKERWMSWATAKDVRLNGKGGLGFCFAEPVTTPEGQLLAFDLDACVRPDGSLAPWAEAFVECCGRSYTEVTPSGRGLRVFVLAPTPPEWVTMHHKPLHATPVEGCNGKNVDCQVFGATGHAGYVTVTGRQLEGTEGRIKQVKDWSWWSKLFGYQVHEGRKQTLNNGTNTGCLPTGFGAEPTMEEIAEKVRATEEGKALMDCEWKGVIEVESNSEAFAMLERLVVKAANWHGETALRFLLRECTGWAREGIDPKYSTEGWVRADLIRTAPGKPSLAPLEPLPAPGEASQGVTTPGAAGPVVPWQRQGIDSLLHSKLAPWVVQHYVRAGQLGFLVSYSTVGKSTLAAAWAVHVAYGVPWGGHRVKGGSVLAIVGEGRRGFANRFEAYRRHLGLPELPQGRHVEVVDLKLPLSDPRGQKAVAALLAAVTKEWGHPPVLVVIDTLSSHWAASEDAAEFAAPAMRCLADAAERYGAAVAVLHHTTKGKGLDVLPTLGDVRGSGAFFSNTDFVLAACRTPAGVRLVGLKLKDDELPAEMLLASGSVALGADEEGDPTTGHILVPVDPEAASAALDAVDEAKARAQAVEVEQVVAAVHRLGVTGATRTAVRSCLRMNREKANEVIDRALEQGLIEPMHDGSRAPFRVREKANTGVDPGKAKREVRLSFD